MFLPLWTSVPKRDLTAEGQHHAVAIGDYDNDGDEDIYVGSKFAPNALYRNDGNMTFTEVGDAAEYGRRGVHNAAIWFDFDNDGTWTWPRATDSEATILRQTGST